MSAIDAQRQMMFEVRPDELGGWQVARNHVVTAAFSLRERAIDHAGHCLRNSCRSGTAARIVIRDTEGNVVKDQSYDGRLVRARERHSP